MAFGEDQVSSAIRSKGMRMWASETVGQRLDTDRAPSAMVEWYVEQQARVQDRVGAALLDFVQTIDLRERVRDLPIPTLVIFGENDPMIAEGEARHQAELLGARLEIIPGIAHGVTVLATRECVRLVHDFWCGVEPR
jgi:pimeloyl-ACP methyl ester carboxylesterase